MINIHMDWKKMELNIDGHAGWAAPGEDLLCCGVTVLIMTLLTCLEEGEKRGRLKTEIKAEDGMYKRIRANPYMGTLGETKAYFRYCMTGLKELGRQYPRNVHVTEVV